jgi:hypothetical protein
VLAKGEILGFGLSGALVGFDTTVGGHTVKGWEMVFYIFGSIGILWFPFFYWRIYDNPDAHPGCSPEEVALIKEGKKLAMHDKVLNTQCVS